MAEKSMRLEVKQEVAEIIQQPEEKMTRYDFEDRVKVQGNDLVIELKNKEVKEFWTEMSLYPCLERIESEAGSRTIRMPKDEALMILDNPGYPRPLFDRLAVVVREVLEKEKVG